MNFPQETTRKNIEYFQKTFWTVFTSATNSINGAWIAHEPRHDSQHDADSLSGYEYTSVTDYETFKSLTKAWDYYRDFNDQNGH